MPVGGEGGGVVERGRWRRSGTACRKREGKGGEALPGGEGKEELAVG